MAFFRVGNKLLLCSILTQRISIFEKIVFVNEKKFIEVSFVYNIFPFNHDRKVILAMYSDNCILQCSKTFVKVTKISCALIQRDE